MVEYKLNFQDYRIAECSLIANDSFDIDKAEEIPFDISIDAQLTTNAVELLIVTINTTIFEDSAKKNYPFELRVTLQGKFDTFGHEVDFDNTEEEKKYLELGLKELFPYLRSFITNLTGNAGYVPMVLPMIDLSSIVEKR